MFANVLRTIRHFVRGRRLDFDLHRAHGFTAINSGSEVIFIAPPGRIHSRHRAVLLASLAANDNTLAKRRFLREVYRS